MALHSSRHKHSEHISYYERMFQTSVTTSSEANLSKLHLEELVSATENIVRDDSACVL